MDKLDKKWYKIKAYLKNNPQSNVEIHRQGNSIIWKQQSSESLSLTEDDLTDTMVKTE